MSASERFLPTRVRVWSFAVLMMLPLATCGDPARTLQAPSINALRLLLILDPNSSSQPLLVQHAGHGDSIAAQATLRSGGSSTAGVVEHYRCGQRYGTLVQYPHCLVFGITPQPGATYTVTVEAEGIPTATATTTVPADFRIVMFTTTGAAPKPGTISGTWTRSAGTHRYVVAISGMPTTNCTPDSWCNDRWYAVTRDTTVSAQVDSRYLEGSTGPYRVDVYAMNRDAYEYVMTGSDNDFFPVPPGQNVQGGYGGVGAWVRRSVPLR